MGGARTMRCISRFLLADQSGVVLKCSGNVVHGEWVDLRVGQERSNEVGFIPSRP